MWHSRQGALIGQHNVMLEKIMETLQQLTASVNQLSSGLEGVGSQLPSAASPAAPPPAAVTLAVPTPATSHSLTMSHTFPPLLDNQMI